ncbi:MAG: hypothetical protein JST35_01425 [Armatimonadetes bacterium]|nr:hypothetical protein [Armatimonadota bacterium]
MKRRRAVFTVLFTLFGLIVAVVLSWPSLVRIIAPRAPRFSWEASIIADNLDAAGEPTLTGDEMLRGLQNRPEFESLIKDPAWFKKCLAEMTSMRVIPREERSYKPGDDVDYGDTLIEVVLDERRERVLCRVAPIPRASYFQPDFSDYREVKKSLWNSRDQFLIASMKTKRGETGQITPKDLKVDFSKWTIPNDALVYWSKGRVDVLWDGTIYRLPTWPDPEDRVLYAVIPRTVSQ